MTYDGTISISARSTPQNIADRVYGTVFHLKMDDMLMLDHPLFPVPSVVQQPVDLIPVAGSPISLIWKESGLAGEVGLLSPPVQLIFQRGKRLFAHMGIQDVPQNAGQGYPDPAKASV